MIDVLWQVSQSVQDLNTSNWTYLSSQYNGFSSINVEVCSWIVDYCFSYLLLHRGNTQTPQVRCSCVLPPFLIDNQPDTHGLELLLRDSTNCPLIQASKAKNQATPGGANLLSTRTPERAKTITWADVARGNSVEKPIRPIRARLARTKPLMQHGGVQCRWTWLAGGACSATKSDSIGSADAITFPIIFGCNV